MKRVTVIKSVVLALSVSVAVASPALAYVDPNTGGMLFQLLAVVFAFLAYLILTSDHGEMFERGIRGHITRTLYEPVVRVLLLIAKPRQRERKEIYEPTSCVDLVPTLLHITGKAIPDWCEGNLLPSFGDSAARGHPTIFAVEAKSNPKQAPLSKGTVALVKDQHKLIHYFGYDGYESKYELYDLTNDPEELEELYTSKKSIAEDLKDQLAEKLRQVNQQSKLRPPG